MAGGPNRQPSPSLTNKESEVSTRPHTPTRPDATPAHHPSPAPITLILNHIPALVCGRLFFTHPLLPASPLPLAFPLLLTTHFLCLAHLPPHSVSSSSRQVPVSGAIDHCCSPSCRLTPCTSQHVATLSSSLDNASSCHVAWVQTFNLTCIINVLDS
ncbi:hypothetical protein BD779DRAFT_1493138, partial [Infundibulicybe gibba]